MLFGLSVKNSLIIKVTDKITSLQRLESLTLDNCSLSEMPSLDGMPKLLRVSLPNNRLSKLEGLMNVRQLFLYHNLFTSIPIQTETDALTQINMNYNPVNDISMITAYTNLTELRLSNTEVTFIPESIDELQKLSFLDLSFSKIIQLPKSIFKLTRLKFLVIQGNAFSDDEINNIKSGFSTNRATTNLLI